MLAGLELAGFKASVAAVDKDSVLKSEIDDRVRGHAQAGWRRDGQVNVDKHIGAEGETGIVCFQAKLQGACGRIHLGQNRTDSRGKGPARPGQCDARHRAPPEECGFVFKDLCYYPESAMARDWTELAYA